MEENFKLYSYRGEYPQKLPPKIRLDDGSVLTSLEELPKEKLNSLGYYGPISIPEYKRTHNKLLWNSDKLEFQVVELESKEIWHKIRLKRDLLLRESDWTMLADVPGIHNLPEWEKYRSDLRDIPEMYLDPKDVVWPIRPDRVEEFENPVIVEPCLRWRVSDLERVVNYMLPDDAPIDNLIGKITD